MDELKRGTEVSISFNGKLYSKPSPDGSLRVMIKLADGTSFLAIVPEETVEDVG